MQSKSENWLLLHKKQIGFSKRAGTFHFKRKDVDNFNEEFGKHSSTITSS